MTFAILAAGEGSRLAQEGVEVPKPLVKIGGEAMIDRLIRIFHDCGAEGIYIITNNLTPLTQGHLQRLQETDATLRLIVKTTPSSMHSFYELRQVMGDGKFCLTTVDTIFREDEFKEYIQAWQDSTEDGMMAVTDYVDDEKPLYIATDEQLNITAFLDQEPQRFISGGIYGLDEKSFPVIDKCIAEGQSRMRNFQRQLVKEGLRLKAYPFGKILDVDHASDIEKAEAFLDNNKHIN
ncbi:MAG: NTP transferase domain-containing protein [Bacteroidaceae bacterium]|nr:NTP transferase domain-containing protein [Bacteroidaceae bacterium]